MSSPLLDKGGDLEHEPQHFPKSVQTLAKKSIYYPIGIKNMAI